MLLIVRIKRCESALAGGRLDEACELLRRPDVRAHRRGQELTDAAVVALVQRGREHLAAGRLAAASEDGRNATLLAGNTSDVAALQVAVDHARATEQTKALDAQQALATARRLVNDGQLTLGGAMAARAVDAGHQAPAGVLLADIHARQASFDRLNSAVQTAIGQEQWELAIQRLREADRLRPNSSDVQAMKRTIGDRVAKSARESIDAGRLDAAGAMLGRVASLAAEHHELAELDANLALCRTASADLRAARFPEARQALHRLALVFPQAKWIGQTLEAIGRADDAVDRLRAGPLALLSDAAAEPPARPAAQVRNAPASVVPARRFLLHVDGAGSFLVLQADPCHVGPISASRAPELPLMTAAGSPTVTLSRSEDAYLLSAASPVMLNERPTTSALLADGDRIGLGPRCRIHFRQPNAASTSAVLQVSRARLPWGSVREVILMGRELVIGPSSTAHVRTRDSGAQIVLHATDGRLLCRSNEPLTIDGHPAANHVEVNTTARVSAGDTSFAIQAA